MKYTAPVSLMAIALFAFAFLGCSSDAPKTNKDKGNAATTGDGHKHDGAHDHGKDKDKEEVKLSADDLAAVKAQKICPVTKEKLDSMGVPIKVDVKGGPIWVCCKSCIKEVKANPEKFLAVLKKNKS
ncbi:hypothetical protein MNBD_PLANCTO02-1087 [hydrothermal vent metagenome]|uniref:Uncharacterized protein n=1 Tax=hydrothermal vent metagenome TaxID=652676 RepID=A0A3B1DNL5_9ZZZZ